MTLRAFASRTGRRYGLAILAWATVIGLRPPGTVAQQGDAVVATPIDYNWDVRPILSEYCFSCHGPDEKARRAGLRLDRADSAFAALRSSPSRHAIVAGDPARSELIARVGAENEALRMPPRQTNKALTAAQIQVLRDWIAQGARYKPHWAFIRPEKPPIPDAAAAGMGPIDRFVLARLRNQGLTFSPEADRETLINRVSMTLTGLPPTIAEIDAFEADKSPQAYERVVDRLLASPAYAEHMAADWLDLARYSESDGFLDDLHDRLFWPYRDWVIKAFQRNMPFDQFGTWQIAGDLMASHAASPAVAREQRLATAFLRVGRRNTENGSIDEEYRVEYVVDRTNTVGAAFLGLTTGCARCHDHKYDPISQKDFYALSGFFNSTDEPGFYAPGSTGITAGPTLAWTDPSTDRKLKHADAAITARESALRAAGTAAAKVLARRADALAGNAPELARLLEESVNSGLVGHYPFEDTTPIPDEEVPSSRPQGRRPKPPLLAPETVVRSGQGRPVAGGGAVAPAGQARRPAGGGQQAFSVFGKFPSDLVREDLVYTPSVGVAAPPAVLEAPVFRQGVKGKAFYFTDTNRGFLGADVGYFERTQPFSLDFWIFAGQEYDGSTVLNHRENDNSGGAGYALQLEQKNRLRVDVMHSRAGNKIQVLTRDRLPAKRWTHVTMTYDGSSRASGVTVYFDGVVAPVDVLRDNLTRTILVEGGGTLGDEFLGLQFGKRFRETTLKDGAIDELRVYSKELTPLEVHYLQDSTVTSGAGVRHDDVLALLVSRDPRVEQARARLVAAREAQNQIISVVPEVPVMGDTPTPRPTYLLVRGQYTDHGDELQPAGLAQVFRWDDALPRTRIGLARWLFDPANPLTARVFVNRLWQMQFGRGLVETSEDLGSQGAVPTHPELLDWLAVTFVETGWNIRSLQKELVMSRTYRQSSTPSDDVIKADPGNRLLARAASRRMSAEEVRDSALAASGLLVGKVGGASVYPYQPEGIWDGLTFYRYPAPGEIPADDQHRRSIYSFIKRNAPHPAMATFDFPDRGGTLSRRQLSNTPLQALVLLNDPQYLEAYRALAERVMKASSDRDSQIESLFRLATRRRPRPNELPPMRAFYDEVREGYTADPARAAKLFKAGVAPVNAQLEPAPLAALTTLAAVVMNTADAYTIR